jgi:hypothetical protein
MQVGFRHIKWFNHPSAWQDMQNRRERRSAAIKAHLDMMNAVNNAFATAQQNSISGLAKIAAQAALNRVQAAAKAKQAEVLKGIDEAQSLIGQNDTIGSNSAPTVDTVA